MSILLEGVHKRFGDHVVVNRVNLEVTDGELFVLLGGSGSGKSTLLRLIAGLVRVDAGKVFLQGQDVTQLTPQARGIGFVFQNYSLFRHMTVAENIEFGLKLRKQPVEERRRRVDELLDLVDLAGLGARLPRQLSGGQQQRVALARALAYRPEVLLLDEPFGALDVKIRAQLRRSLKDIQKRLKVTTILVTHDQEEGFELADRVGVIERGSLLEVGPPEELYRRPHSQFVATFVGSANVLVGRVEAEQIRLGEVLLPMPEQTPAHLEGAPVRVLTRPENVVIGLTEALGEGVYPLGPARVEEATFSGSLRRLRLAIPRLRGVRCISPPLRYGQAEIVLDAVVTSDAGLEVRAGTELFAGFNSYQLLERTGLKSLVCLEPLAAGSRALVYGQFFSHAVDAPVALLSVLGPGEPEDSVGVWLATHKERFSKALAVTRRGRLHSEIVREVQEGRHELVVLGSFGTVARTVLAEAGVPVLIANPRDRLNRLLVCTAGGEPGKMDVWMGGRIGLRARAAVTVLHVLEPGASPHRRARAEHHLEQAASSLSAMGANVLTLLREADDPADLILKQGHSGEYDLLVVGAPGTGRAVQRDLASRVTAGPLPVLLVPMPG